MFGFGCVYVSEYLTFDKLHVTRVEQVKFAYLFRPNDTNSRKIVLLTCTDA